MEDLLVRAIVYIITGIISYAFTALLYYLKAHKKFQILQDIIENIFYTVEQSAEFQQMTGAQKKEYAMQLAKKTLSEMHIKVSDEVLDNLIEATVFWYNHIQGYKEDDTI